MIFAGELKGWPRTYCLRARGENCFILNGRRTTNAATLVTSNTAIESQATATQPVAVAHFFSRGENSSASAAGSRHHAYRTGDNPCHAQDRPKGHGVCTIRLHFDWTYLGHCVAGCHVHHSLVAKGQHAEDHENQADHHERSHRGILLYWRLLHR